MYGEYCICAGEGCVENLPIGDIPLFAGNIWPAETELVDPLCPDNAGQPGIAEICPSSTGNSLAFPRAELLPVPFCLENEPFVAGIVPGIARPVAGLGCAFLRLVNNTSVTIATRSASETATATISSILLAWFVVVVPPVFEAGAWPVFCVTACVTESPVGVVIGVVPTVAVAVGDRF